MTLRNRFKNVVVFPAVSFFRYLYSTGQTYFPYVKLGDYLFKQSSHPVTKAMIAAGIVGNLGTNSIVKIPAVYRDFNHDPASDPIAPIYLQTKGKCVSALIRVSGMGMILLEFLSGDFGVVYLFDQIGKPLGINFHNNLAGSISLQVLGAMGGGSSAKIFHAYDYTLVKRNADRLGALMDEGNFLAKIRENPMPLAKTSATMAINLITYMMLAVFWAKAAVDDFSASNGMFDQGERNTVCFFAAFCTSVFTLGWAPTVYDIFAEPAAGASAARDRHYRDNCKTQFIKVVGGYSLPVDVLTWAVTTYMAVVSNASDFADCDPYGPIIGLGILCGLSAGGFYGISLSPGLKTTLANCADDLVDTEALLSVNSAESGSEPDVDRVEGTQAIRDAASVAALVSSRLSKEGRTPSPELPTEGYVPPVPRI